VVRDANTDRPDLVGQQQADDARSVRYAACRHDGSCRGKALFVQDLFGGADETTHRLPVACVTEYAWHSLFIRNLLIRPERRPAGFECPS
jgi:ATP-dependent phosphoenolpyruvate carboxykinase